MSWKENAQGLFLPFSKTRRTAYLFTDVRALEEPEVLAKFCA